MAGSRALVTDPLRSFKFNVVIPLRFPGTKTLGLARLGFMSAAGLGVSIEPLTYREGGDNLTTRKLPGQADINPITLSRGLFYGDPQNWYWMTYLFSAMYGGAIATTAASTGPLGGTGAPVGSAPDFRTAMYINVLQHPNNTSGAPGGNPIGATWPAQNSIVQVSFKLYSAWIGTLAYSDFDAGGNAVAVEQLSLNYEGFETQFGTPYVANPTSW